MSEYWAKKIDFNSRPISQIYFMRKLVSFIEVIQILNGAVNNTYLGLS